MRATIVPVPDAELARFEALYAEAERTGDRSHIPWDHDRPNPTLVAWLDSEAPGTLRCGSRVAVIGCGRGHDARELLRRGYEVTAFDCSQAAVRAAKALDPENAACYFRADLFDLPPRWVHRFDLVVEIHTLQALPPVHRPRVMDGAARLVGASGILLVITRAVERPVAVESGPPWPLTQAELVTLADEAGLSVIACTPLVAGEPPSPRLRAVLGRRGSGT